MNSFLTSFGDISLTVSPQKMYETASGIEAKITDSKKDFETLVQKANATSAYWEGDAAETSRKQFEKQNENFQKLIANLTNYVTELRMITSIYESSESMTAEAANSLASGILS